MIHRDKQRCPDCHLLYVWRHKCQKGKVKGMVKRDEFPELEQLKKNAVSLVEQAFIAGRIQGFNESMRIVKEGVK